MARRQAIEAEELFETANRLSAEGVVVTATVLLDALGGGSLRTIYKYLEEWKKGQPKETKITPVEIPDSVQAGFGVMWRTAVAQAMAGVEVLKEKSLEEVKEANSQFMEALGVIDKLEKEAEIELVEKESLKEKIAKLEELLKSSEGTGIALIAKCEQLDEQMKAEQKEKEKQRAERDEAMKQAAELKGRVETLKDQNEALLKKLGNK